MKTNLIRVLAGFIILSSFAMAPAHAEDQPSVITGDVVIEGGTHIWTSPVVVAPNASLTIRNATVFLDYINSCTPRSNVTVCTVNLQVDRATLHVENSTIDSHVWSKDETSSGYDIQGWASTYDFKGSTFQHYSSVGNQGPGSPRSTIKGNTFRFGITALWFWRGAEADVVGNEFADDYHSLELRDTTALVRGNHFNRSQLVFDGVGTGRALDIQSTTLGEKLFVTDPLVENNVIENGSLGILNLNAHSDVIRNNVIRNNAVGISIGLIAGNDTLNKGAPTFSGNQLDGNTNAVFVYVSGAPRNGTEARTAVLHGNSLINTVCNDITASQVPAAVTLKVDATGNWWGSSAGPQDRVVDEEPCPALVGANITVSPWLTTAP